MKTSTGLPPFIFHYCEWSNHYGKGNLFQTRDKYTLHNDAIRELSIADAPVLEQWTHSLHRWQEIKEIQAILANSKTPNNLLP